MPFVARAEHHGVLRIPLPPLNTYCYTSSDALQQPRQQQSSPAAAVLAPAESDYGGVMTLVDNAIYS